MSTSTFFRSGNRVPCSPLSTGGHRRWSRSVLIAGLTAYGKFTAGGTKLRSQIVSYFSSLSRKPLSAESPLRVPNNALQLTKPGDGLVLQLSAHVRRTRDTPILVRGLI